MENGIMQKYSNTDIRALIPPQAKTDQLPKSEVFKKVILSKYENVIDIELSELELITSEILQLKSNVAENTIVLGMKLIQVKENIGRGNWLPYLEEKIDFTPRTANRFMKLAKEYGNTKKTSMSYLEPTKMIMLLDLPSIEREQFISDNYIENMSCRELTKKIKEVKDAKKAEKKAAKEAKVIEVEVQEVTKSDNNIESIDVKDYAETHVNSSQEITKNTIDTESVLKKADALIEEIKIRTGSFSTSCNSWEDVNCSDRGGVLAQLYATDVITLNELIETVAKYKIDLEINYKELEEGTLKEKYLNKVYNSYSHYCSIGHLTYLNILAIEDFKYENVTDFDGWSDDEMKEDFIRSYMVEKKGIEILGGYDMDGYLSLCIYNNKKLLGHYFLGENWNPLEEDSQEDLLDNVKGLEKLEHIELEGLYKKWLKQYIGYYKREEKRKIIESDNYARRKKYGEEKYKWNSTYNNYTSFKFEDIYDEDCRVKDYEKFKANSKEYLDNLRKQSNEYKSYDFGGLLENTTIKEEEKPTYKKMYKTLAMNFHPDKGGTTEEMQIVNSLKKTWGV